MSELRTFKTEEELYKQFKEICVKEGIGVGDKLNEFIKQYIKEHGDGNPAFTLDQFQDPTFKACPAFFRQKQDWFNYLSTLKKTDFKEAEQQLNTIIMAYKEASKRVL